jgi:hypothetical protein
MIRVEIGSAACAAALLAAWVRLSLSSSNAREMLYVQNDYGSFQARLLH